MKIILDEVKKDGVLINKNGEEVSRYSYKNIINDSYTLEYLKKDLDGFNVTLGQQAEFDAKDLKKLSEAKNIHNWG